MVSSIFRPRQSQVHSDEQRRRAPPLNCADVTDVTGRCRNTSRSDVWGGGDAVSVISVCLTLSFRVCAV